MNRATRLIPVFVAAALAVAACGSSGTAAKPASSSAPSAAPAGSSSAAAPPTSSAAAPGTSTAASSAAANAPAPAGETKVSITVSFLNSIPAMGALEVAQQRGYFKSAGLDLTFASAIGGGDTLRAVTTGSADIAIGSPAASVLAAQGNKNLKIAAIWLPYNPFYFIGTKPVSKLDGASLGGSVGASTVNLLIDGLQEKLGVKFNNQKAGTGSMADDWDAVKSGHLQASWAMQPFVTQQEEQSGAVVVIDPSKTIPDYPADFVVVNEKFAEQHKAAMQGFFTAIERIFGDFSNPSAQSALATDLAKVMVFPAPVLDKYLTTESTERLKATYSLKMNEQVLENISHLMQKANLIKSPVDWPGVVDQSYLPAADQLANLH